jgi:outer membrane protein OmpA-like peptidoglycan-associated protein
MLYKCSASNIARMRRTSTGRAGKLLLGSASLIAPAVTLLLATALPLAVWAQTAKPHPAQKKSAEEILNTLLGGSERGPAHQGAGASTRAAVHGERPRIAVPIHFAYNSAQITPDSYAQLDQVARALNDVRLRGVRIGVEGHTDNQGSAAYNQRLSQRRADAVRRYLIEHERVAASRLIATGYGKSRPLPGVFQDTEEGRAANRRVEFVNLGTGRSVAAVPQAKPGAAHKLSVRVVVTYKRGSETHVLTSNGVLTSTDHYRITFTPDRNSYVYVYRIDSSGQATAAFPNPDYSAATNPTKGRRAYTVPAAGDWFEMDQRPGREEIVVLASETALRDPMVVAQRMRASPLAGAVRGPAVDVRADVSADIPAGVFSYRLPFEHR